MSARKKLNVGFATGSLFLAAIAGGLTQSWLIFFLALVLLLLSNVYLGEIRPRRPGRR